MKYIPTMKTKTICATCAHFRPSTQAGRGMGFCRFFRQARAQADQCRSGYVPAQRPENRRP